MLTADRLQSPMELFAQRMESLPNRHPRRVGLLLGQAGLLVTAACFCISIAGMNIGLVMTLVGCVVAGAPLHRTVGMWALVGWLAALGVSTLVHGEGKELVSSAVIPLGLLTAQVLFHPAVPGSARLWRVLAGVVVVTVVAAVVLALGQYVIGYSPGNRPFRINPQGEHFFQSSGFFSLHLTQGVIMGLLFFLLIPLTAGLGRAWKYVSIGAATIGVAICGARAALLGIVLAGGGAIAARGRRFLIIGALVVVVLLAMVLGILRLTQPQRFDNLLAMRDGRWPIWRTTLHIIGDHPWIGTGGSKAYRAAYLEAYPLVEKDIPNEFPKGAPHAHNTPLAHAAENGIPSAVAWFVLLLVPLLHLWKLRTVHPTLFRSAVGMAVMVLVFGQFEKLDGEASRVLWTGLGLLLALACAKPSCDTNPVETPEK